MRETVLKVRTSGTIGIFFCALFCASTAMAEEDCTSLAFQPNSHSWFEQNFLGKNFNFSVVRAGIEVAKISTRFENEGFDFRDYTVGYDFSHVAGGEIAIRSDYDRNSDSHFFFSMTQMVAEGYIIPQTKVEQISVSKLLISAREIELHSSGHFVVHFDYLNSLSKQQLIADMVCFTKRRNEYLPSR